MRFKYVYVFPGTGGFEVVATLGADDETTALMRARIECRTLGAELIECRPLSAGFIDFYEKSEDVS